MRAEEERQRAIAALREDRHDGARPDEATLALVRRYLQAKASPGPAELSAPVRRGVEIQRDDRGIPHIVADDPYDLFFGFGYAHAQDRLWQLDYLRRQATGRLAEVFGPEKLESDILSRTLGMSRLADETFSRTAAETRDALIAFSDGVNAWLDRLPAGLPVEFELLDYQPEQWRPQDSLAILRRWWWYLTGRLNVLSTPEAVRAGLDDAALVRAFFQPDGPVTYIVPSGHYDPDPAWPGLPSAPREEPLWGTGEPGGSNNWATAPAINSGEHALVASDPHVYFTLPAEWYEIHLRGAGYDVLGATYPGLPAVLFGRNRHLAWGITNNICSQRDLYVERLNDEGAYQRDESWEPLAESSEDIPVKGDAPYRHVTRFAHGRPLVDHLVPEAARPSNLLADHESCALSLAWVGFEMTDEPTALLGLNRAETIAQAREALAVWRCPTWNLVVADDNGDIGYQCVGAIPLRGREHRGYREANRPDDAWRGFIPYAGLPALHEPQRGWVASANNPTAPPDFPYPLAGTWAPEDRAGRAEALLEERQPHTLDGFAAMQLDVHSGRAERGVPGLLAAVDSLSGEAAAQALALLRSWDYRLTTESAAGAIFYVFFWRWHQRVIRERFTEALRSLVQDSGWGLSSQLLHEDSPGWFVDEKTRRSAIRESFHEALDWLRDRCGPDVTAWQWGDLHRLGAIHPAARTPLQHALFDLPPRPHSGGASTLASAFYGPPGSFETRLGASYRLLADLSPAGETRTICWPGQSGHPGSVHYADQVERHLAGEYGIVKFDLEAVEQASRIRILPA